MMRIALVAWDYPPAATGLAAAAREIAESLREAGADVTVFTLDRAGEATQGAIIGCAVPAKGRLARLKALPGVGRLAAPASAQRAVLAAHRAQPFDVVEATNWYAPGVLLAGRDSFAFVTRNSTPAALSRPADLSSAERLDGWTVDRLEARGARRSDGLISNTAAHATEIAGAYGLSDAVPHAAIGLSLPPAMLERGRQAAYPGSEGPVRLLFIGKPDHRKGFDLILDAVERLVADPALDFDVALVGAEASDLPATLSKGARARLRPLGRQTAEAVAYLYEQAHLVLAPSRYESFGLVYQEALAYGRPVIACSLDASARAFIGEPGAGLMSDPSGEAMADAIGRTIRDPGLRGHLRVRALASAGRFDRRSLGTETLALYERAIAHRQARAARS